MPKATGSKIGVVLTFFKKASMELVDEALALVRETVRERRDLLDKIKAGQAKAAKKRTPAPAPTPAAQPAAATVTGSKKKAVATAKKKTAVVTGKAASGSPASQPSKRKRVRPSRAKARHAPPAALPGDEILSADELAAIEARDTGGYAEGASPV